MQEARIVLPLFDNHGNSLINVHGRLARALTNAFGGYTSFNGVGVEAGTTGDMEREPVAIYDVAMQIEPNTVTGAPDMAQATAVIRGIAVWAADLARQKHVYVRSPDGNVAVLDVAEETAKEASHGQAQP